MDHVVAGTPMETQTIIFKTHSQIQMPTQFLKSANFVLSVFMVNRIHRIYVLITKPIKMHKSI